MLKDGKLIIPEARIEITTKCNAHCTVCPRESMTRPKETMSTARFQDYAEQCVELGAKQLDVFGYGEALLDPDIVSKVAYCKKLGVDTHFTTNASLLTPELSAQLIESGLTHIRFSFHGVEATQYEAIHKGLRWNEVMNNFCSFCNVNDNAGHPVTVHIVSLAFNGEPVDALRRRWESLCDQLEIWRPHNWAGGRQYRKVEYTKKTCGRPFNGPLQINVDGTLMVCCFDYDAQMVIGNANVNSIKDILENSSLLEEIQSRHTLGIYARLPCGQCDQLKDYKESPLLYSTVDPKREVGKIAITKQKVEV